MGGPGWGIWSSSHPTICHRPLAKLKASADTPSFIQPQPPGSDDSVGGQTHGDADNEGRFDKGHGDQDAIGGNADINSLGEVIIEEELLNTPKIVYSVKVGSTKLYLPATFVNW